MAEMKRRRTRPLVSARGATLTEERLEELAIEAERGHDLSRFTVRTGTRPSLGEWGSSPRLSFRVSPETFQAARRKADEESVSLSEVAREAIRRHVGA
jgi:hypothetical protein